MPGIVQTLPIIHSFPILKVDKLTFQEGNVQNHLIGNKQEKQNQNSDSQNSLFWSDATFLRDRA